MNKSLLTLFIAFTPLLILAQPAIVREEWNNKPVLHTIDPKHNNEAAVIILDKRRTEYIDEANDELSVYQTLHKIVRVMDDRGIESYNKFYLGVSDNNDIVDIRARTILPGGKVINVDKKNIKDQQDEDGNRYKIFAMEGLEKGCEVEFTYTYKKVASYFGREILQGEIPVLRTEIEIISPERLIFETKSYNTELKSIDTVINGKRYVRIYDNNIVGVDEEKYSFYRANLRRVEFKLSFNRSRNNERIFTWNELAKRVFEAYSSHSEKELKKVADLIKKNGWTRLPSDKEKIVAVETFIKNNYANREDINGEDASNLEKIIKNKIASFLGIARLYSAIYKQLGLNFQLVLAGNRQDFIVDKSFENWNNTDNILFYFINEKKFLSPTRIEMRFPWIDPHWAGTNALFCKQTTIGNFTTALAEVKIIPLEDYKESYNNIEASVELTSGRDSLLIDTRQLYSGYSASIYRSSFNFTTKEQQREFLKSLVKYNTNSEHILSSKVENEDFDSYTTNKPFTIQAVVKSNELLEKAGNKLILKVGQLIGSQVEMYQEKPRAFPMELGYPHVLARKIRITIPEGYTIKNLQDLKINKVVTENDTSTMGFVSDYRQEGNVIIIDILEEYKKTSYPTESYQSFREVINAAADFNKVVLLLEKS